MTLRSIQSPEGDNVTPAEGGEILNPLVWSQASTAALLPTLGFRKANAASFDKNLPYAGEDGSEMASNAVSRPEVSICGSPMASCMYSLGETGWFVSYVQNDGQKVWSLV